jgi:nondiscriminating aspartyl-tRNA synthetase
MRFCPNQVEEEDAQPSESTTGDAKDKMPTVPLQRRLDNRILDLRVPTNQAIFRLQAAVCQLYRETMMTQGFMEIHTPKMLGGSSEGGANVFAFKYFGKDACLAQSPQLYKQMAIMADFGRVYEIGPVFRAEKSFTPRHLCEFTGLDFEMEIKESYMEVLDSIEETFSHMFAGLESRYKEYLNVVCDQYPFTDFKMKTPVVKLTFQEGVDLLKEHGVEQDAHDDLDTVNEKTLGRLVREKYDTDFYILHKYPVAARPFYTMPHPDDDRYTCSYDVFMRGEEIISGAQRIHDVDLLIKKAEEKGMDISTLKSYIDSFKYGAYPHGGVGIGMERVVKYYLNLHNIKKTSMFPRDPQRLQP